MSVTAKRGPGRRFPQWLKKRIPAAGMSEEVRRLLKDLRLVTVCQSARCPNLCECFASGTTTFMILGDSCTRNCRFCAVPHGQPPPPDPGEPARVAEATAQLKLRHVVVTSVTRDDLPDGGADHFRKVILAIRENTRARIEVLTPDFKGVAAAIESVLSARPDVFNHNIETIRRLYRAVRPEANYSRSLEVLRRARQIAPEITIKSGMMVGLGERIDEILESMRNLREVGCDFLTLGQYLQPTPVHHPIARFVTPDEFADLKDQGMKMGFSAVASGPFVRSSWHAGDLFDDALRPAPPK